MAEFYSFANAKSFIRDQGGYLTKATYSAWVKANGYGFLPRSPQRVYASEWHSWGDYLANGHTTWRLRDETKDAISRSTTGKPKSATHRSRIGEGHQETRNSTRQKLRAVHVGKSKSQTHRAKIKEKRAQQVFTEESNIKRSISVSAAKTGVKRKPFTLLHRFNMGNQTRGKTRDPAAVEKSRTGLIGKKHSAERRLKNSKSHIGKKASPTSRNKMSAARKCKPHSASHVAARTASRRETLAFRRWLRDNRTAKDMLQEEDT